MGAIVGLGRQDEFLFHNGSSFLQFFKQFMPVYVVPFGQILFTYIHNPVVGSGSVTVFQYSRDCFVWQLHIIQRQTDLRLFYLFDEVAAIFRPFRIWELGNGLLAQLLCLSVIVEIDAVAAVAFILVDQVVRHQCGYFGGKRVVRMLRFQVFH